MKRDANCPLCGAKLPPSAWLDACDELLDSAEGILAARCPACQGRLEILAQPGSLQLGFHNGKNFSAALSLDYPGLQVEITDGRLHLRAEEREWDFVEAEE
jgi:hypothetical protein